MEQKQHSGPLTGVVVLDLSRVLAGPWATQALADLGAEVIKIERPGVGDDTRHWGPPFAAGPDGVRGDAAYFFAANRNKRSVTVDIAHPQGAALVRALAAKADVLVENFKVGGLEKYGLDYPALAEVHPGLVYCSITGFGQTGPDAGRAGYDYMIQAVGGLMSITGEEGRPPVKVGVAVADLFAGLYASNAILAALLHARATGEGQHLDISLFEAQAAMLANQATGYFVSGEVPRALGAVHPNLAPYQPLPTKDGALVVAVGNDGQFRALCLALRADLAADPRFATNAQRVAHRAELTAALEAVTRGTTTGELAAALDAAGVPCGPINRIDQVFAEPQAVARELVVEQTREGQTIRTVASPMRLSKTPVSYRTAPPALGADTGAVLSEQLGLSAEQIDRLRAAGAI